MKWACDIVGGRGDNGGVRRGSSTSVTPRLARAGHKHLITILGITWQGLKTAWRKCLVSLATHYLLGIACLLSWLLYGSVRTLRRNHYYDEAIRSAHRVIMITLGKSNLLTLTKCNIDVKK